MVVYPSHHYDPYAHKNKTNDIFEQTVIIDKPLSRSFYDSLKEVTLEAEIVIGRKGVVEEIVPLEQWESVISNAIPATEDEEWIVEPEETLYTVVKWEGVEGGEKHIVENRQWKEVSHTPPIHTKEHVSPMIDFEANENKSLFSFDGNDHFIHISDNTPNHTTSPTTTIPKKSEVVFEKPHVTESAETTWHVSRQESTSHTSSYTNGYVVSPKVNDDPLGPWHKIERPVENGGSFKSESNPSTPEPRIHHEKNDHTIWHKTHVKEPTHSYHTLVRNAELPHSPHTQTPKPKTFTYATSFESKYSTPEAPKRLSSPIGNGTARSPSPKPFPRSNTVASGGPAPLPSPPVEKHIYIAAKPASHFVTSYTVKNSASNSEEAKSPTSSPGVQQKVTWRRTHGNQYVREYVPINPGK